MKESLLSTIFMEFVLMNNLISKLKIWLRATPIEDYFIPTVLLVLVFSTDNRLILITKQLAVVLTVAIFCFALVSRRRPSLSTIVGKIQTTFFILICLSFFYTCDRLAYIQYFPYVIAVFFLTIFEFDGRFFSCLIKQFEFLFWVFIFSMYLELLAPSLFASFFGFLDLGSNRSAVVVDNGGAISGLAYEKGYAAFLCNMGLGVLFAKLFVKGFALTRLLQIVGVFAALMMTGKRTLFLIPVMGLIVFALFFSKKHKFSIALGLSFALVMSLAVADSLIPQVSLVFDRLFADNGDLLSGRQVIWTYAMQMFESSPLIGRGFLSFNSYINAHGFRYYGLLWNYQAHNVYLQLLAELGIVGFLLFVILLFTLAFGLIRSFLIWKDTQGAEPVILLTAVYWVMLIAVYSLTGNTIYYSCQLVVLGICIAMYQTFRYKKALWNNGTTC